jgi:hypothetical protein
VSGERLRRVACALAGVWAGLMAGIGFVAAPTLFAQLGRADAGRVAGRLFLTDAYLGLAFGAVLLLLARQVAKADAERGGSRFSTEMILALAALFCIVAGHFGPQPMLEAARAGGGGASFAVLHGVASAFFVAKLALVAVLAWRLGRPGGPVRAAAPTSSDS